MKKYTYNGTTNLAFTYKGQDYLVHGAGPHDLPEDAAIVKTHLRRGKLVLIGAVTPAETSKNKTATA